METPVMPFTPEPKPAPKNMTAEQAEAEIEIAAARIRSDITRIRSRALAKAATKDSKRRKVKGDWYVHLQMLLIRPALENFKLDGCYTIR